MPSPSPKRCHPLHAVPSVAPGPAPSLPCPASAPPAAVLAQELDAKGGVVALAVAHLRADRPLLLLVHRCSGAMVWDVRWVRPRPQLLHIGHAHAPPA